MLWRDAELKPQTHMGRIPIDVADMGVGTGGRAPLNFVSPRLAPLRKILEKSPSAPLEKILSTPVVTANRGHRGDAGCASSHQT